MHLTIATEAHYRRTADGTIVSDTATNGYELWRRYLDTFDSVHVLARVSPTAKAEGLPVEGQNVQVVGLIPYRGLTELPWVIVTLRRQIAAALTGADAVLAKVPGVIGSILISSLRGQGRPYGVEVVGDPNVVLQTIVPFGGAGLGRVAAAMLRRQCREAAVASYVTREVLQSQYPPGPLTFSAPCSGVHLPDESYATAPRTHVPRRSDNPIILTVGTHAQMYKGQDTLIDAMQLLHRRGLRPELRIVGDGRHRPALQQRAASAGLARYITFLGGVPAGSGVRAAMDQADMFVLPSRTEGLPRALLEAMARGLPCVGTAVGGIPELLSPEHLVAPNDPDGLARKIATVLESPQTMRSMSRRNMLVAADFSWGQLDGRRRLLSAELRARTAAWQRVTGGW